MTGRVGLLLLWVAASCFPAQKTLTTAWEWGTCSKKVPQRRGSGDHDMHHSHAVVAFCPPMCLTPTPLSRFLCGHTTFTTAWEWGTCSNKVPQRRGSGDHDMHHSHGVVAFCCGLCLTPTPLWRFLDHIYLDIHIIYIPIYMYIKLYLNYFAKQVV